PVEAGLLEELQRRERPRSERAREADVEPARSRVGDELGGSRRIRQRRVARPRRVHLLGELRAHVEVAAGVWPAEPLLTRRGVEVAAELLGLDIHRAEALRAVQQNERVA